MNNEHDANNALYECSRFYAEEDREAVRCANKPRIDWVDVALEIGVGLAAVAGAGLVIIGALGMAGFFEVAR